jgi:hypothetical protein
MCVCMYVFMYVWMYLFIYLFIYLFTRIYVCVCMYVCIYLFTRIYVCMYICMYLYIYSIYVCVYACMYVCMCECVGTWEGVSVCLWVRRRVNWCVSVRIYEWVSVSSSHPVLHTQLSWCSAFQHYIPFSTLQMQKPCGGNPTTLFCCIIGRQMCSRRSPLEMIRAPVRHILFCRKYKYKYKYITKTGTWHVTFTLQCAVMASLRTYTYSGWSYGGSH